MYDVAFYLDKLMDYYNVSTIIELAKKLETTQSTISSWKQRASINAVKKKCREAGIYNEIFADTIFQQHGNNSQQIQNQQNEHSSNIIGISEKESIDSDILSLCQALNSVANALDKKQELKSELTNLISKLPTL